MSNMEFLYQNYVNTTTQISVTNAATSQVANLYDRKRSTTFSSVNATGTTNSTFVFSTATSFVVSRIILTGHNLKSFRVFHSSATANTFTLTGYDTTTSFWTTNSQTSTFLTVPTTTVTSICFDFIEAITSGSQKTIAELYIGKDYITFPHNPDFDAYDPTLKEKSIIHEMTDGGKVRYHLGDKFRASIGLTFLSTAERASFKSVYDAFTPFVFVPFPDVSGFDGDYFEVNWTNGFDFYKLQSNVLGNGYQGKITVEETPLS